MEETLLLNLAAEIGRLLNGRHATLATAESCTGGYIAHCITGVAGSSAYFLGGVVSYANRVKEDLLGVTADVLAREVPSAAPWSKPWPWARAAASAATML